MSTTPNTNTEKKPQKAGILKYLDNTIGDDGLRTDVKITITNETLLKLIAAGVALSVLATAASFYTRKILESLHNK